MNKTIALMISCVLLLACIWTSPAHAASSGDDARTLPILVNVDAKGNVGDISSAYSISPGFKKLIHATLSKMITKPAMNKGKPVASQCVITLGVVKQQTAQGQTSVSLKYVGSKALPPGNWYWVRDKQTNKLALANSNAQTWKNNTMDSQQMQDAALNQHALDFRSMGGSDSMSTPSVGTGH